MSTCLREVRAISDLTVSVVLHKLTKDSIVARDSPIPHILARG